MLKSVYLSSPSKPLSEEQVRHREIEDVTVQLLEYCAGVHESKGYWPNGMAAVQLNNPVQVFIVWHKKKYMVCANPNVLHIGKKSDRYETCLSFPGKIFKTARANIIKISYLDKNGIYRRKLFFGKTARSIQHELDHLSGIVPTKAQFKAGEVYAKIHHIKLGA